MNIRKPPVLWIQQTSLPFGKSFSTWKALARALAPSFSRRFLPATNTLSLSGDPWAEACLWHSISASARICSHQISYRLHIWVCIPVWRWTVCVSSPFPHQSPYHSCWASTPSVCGRRDSSTAARFLWLHLVQTRCRSGPAQLVWHQHSLLHCPRTSDKSTEQDHVNKNIKCRILCKDDLIKNTEMQ